MSFSGKISFPAAGATAGLSAAEQLPLHGHRSGVHSKLPIALAAAA